VPDSIIHGLSHQYLFSWDY